MSIVLRVEPEALKTQAAKVEEQIKRLETEFQEIQSIVSRSGGYWVGMAGDQAREAFRAREEDVQQVLRRLREHPVDLLTMAGVYEQTEGGIREDNQALPTDVVV